MTVYNIPYNPRSDPNAFAAQGVSNLMGGIMQGRERNRISDFAGGMDTNATGMQIFQDAMQSGLPPQISMQLAGLQQKMQPNVGAIPFAATQMDPQQYNNWLDNYGKGVTINTGQKLLTEEQRRERAERDQDEAMGRTGPGLSLSDAKILSEDMDIRLEKAKPWWKKGVLNLPENEVYKQWLIFNGMRKFDNDIQKEEVLNTFKNKVKNRAGSKGHETDVNWDDPKWAEAIGLPAGTKTGGSARKADSTAEPVNQAAFEEIVRSMKDPAERQEYYDKYKSQWPGEYE